jgi:hypothetical protein
MEPEDDIAASGPEVSASGKKLHPAGAGLGLVGLILGFGLFAFSFIIGFYLWGVEHSFKWFAGAVAVGYSVNFVLRRLSLR